MSIEIWQFPAAASKSDLTSCLKAIGYKVGENVFRRFPPGTVHLFWSEAKDFKSTSGVDASIFPLDAEGKVIGRPKMIGRLEREHQYGPHRSIKIFRTRRFG